MKKVFPLHLPDKSDSKVITAIQVTLNKYVKRERRKALPEGADQWDFRCRVGATQEDALPCALSEIPAGIDAAASAEHPEVYIEILAEPGQGTRKKATASAETDEGGEG